MGRFIPLIYEHMSEQDIFSTSSGQEGSVQTVPPSGTQGGQAGEGNGASQETDYKALYEELEKKMGSQGDELGGYRKFFQNVEPLLNKLDSQPELVQAIMAGKVDAKLATAALEGKVNVADAVIVNEAHAQVKKDLGDKTYQNMDSETIEKMIAEKASEIASNIVNTKLSEADSLNDFKNKTIDFVQSVPDFDKYADDITKWLEEHPDQDDVSVAYFAVKGLKFDEAVRSGDEAALANAAKEFALNATGGGSQGGQMPNLRNLADSLIASRSNPNNL